MKKVIPTFLFLTLLTTYSVFSQVTLPSVFSDNMILQQQSEIRIWGKAIPQKTVIIIPEWSHIPVKTVVNRDSTWEVNLKTPEASYKEYSLSIESGTKIILNNILIGEVWLCSGQSNMEMKMRGSGSAPVYGSLEDILHSKNNNLRCFTVGRNYSVNKEFNCTGRWEIASPETTPMFSATAYYFGRLIQEVLNVPVGLLCSSYGGSKIEAWMPESAFSIIPSVKIPKSPAEIVEKNKDPGLLYNAMIHPIAGYSIKGAIWYQGESNRESYKDYPLYFKEMIKNWRKNWNCGDFPAYFCQIAPYKYNGSDSLLTAYFREAQLKISTTQPKTAMVVLLDIGEENNLHPGRKQQVGERLAYLALGRTYDFSGIYAESPRYKSVEFKDGKAYLLFENSGTGLASFEKELVSFEVAGDDKIFYPADAKITKTNEMVVWSKKVSSPVAVRYAFKNYAVASLFGANGLPVSSFRSDNW